MVDTALHIELRGEAYEVFFQHAPRPMYVFDPATLSLLDVNEAAETMYGYTRPELLSKTILDLRPPEEVPRVLAHMKEGPPQDMVWQHLRADGTPILLEAGWTSITLGDREARLVVFTDVTAREDALTRLDEERARYRAAVGSMIDGFAILTSVRDDHDEIVDFRFTFANHAAAEFLQTSVHELVGRRTSEVIAPVHDQLRERLIEMIGSGGALEYGAGKENPPFRCAPRRDWELHAAALDDGFVVTFRDVTAATEALHALRESEERFRTVFESCPLGMAVVGPDLRTVDVNPALCRLLGYSRQELGRISILDVTHPEDVDRDADLARQVFAGEIPSYTLEKRYIHRDGSIVHGQLTGSAIFDKDGNPVAGLGIVQDITERKQRELELRAAAAEAEARLGTLTEREREVLEIVGQGLNARQAADHFAISARTAESHLASVYRKLQVTSRDAALNEYRRLTEATERAASGST
jgi:PAS domain S-box-containing protein